MISSDAERVVLDAIRPKLEEQGYEVLVEYDKEILPLQIGGYRPDAVAIRNGDKIAIEIRSRRIETLDKQFDTLRKYFDRSAGWKLEIYYASDFSDRPSLPIQNMENILNKIKEAKKLSGIGYFQAALLLCWATLEAVSRTLLPSSFLRTQTPGRIVTVLVELGHISQEEASFLRGLALKRNAFIHGQLDIAPTSEEVSGFVGILEQLVEPLA